MTMDHPTTLASPAPGWCRRLCAAASRRLRRWLALACLAPVLALASPAPWPDAAYSYFAENLPLQTVLGDFASSFSLALSMQPGVNPTVNGRFTAKSPTEFISRLGGVYGFNWYTHGGVLHVSRASDAVMRSIPLPAGGGGNLRQALTELGVLEPRFGWGELREQGLVIVSGPPGYVDLVEATIRQLPPASSAQQVNVFRLRYAAAEDRVVLYRDRQITQPGMASVLRRLIALPGAAGSGVLNEPASPMQAPLRTAPTLGADISGSQGAAGPAAGEQATGGEGARSGPGAMQNSTSMRLNGEARFRVPSIQSDPRLNAIIVQDVPERMPMYERLIAQLDIPTALIEIEAMIIDVNTERSKELGINWSFRSGTSSVSFGAPAGQPAPGTLAVATGSGSLTPGSGLALLGQIRLLEIQGDARVQSKPSVLTTDNIGALLDLSETFYVRVIGERVASVSPVTSGTTLRVTPHLIDGPDPSIQLTIDIEDGQIEDRQIDALPTVQRSTVSTQAVVRQNDTLVIAGYTSDQNVHAAQKVPFLGDLPGVGALFSTKSHTVQRRERIFMIKPRLVSLAGAPEAGSSQPALAVPAPAR